MTFDVNSAATEHVVCNVIMKSPSPDAKTACLNSTSPDISRRCRTSLGTATGCLCNSDPNEVTAGVNGVCKVIHKHHVCCYGRDLRFLLHSHGPACPVTRRGMSAPLYVIVVSTVIFVCITPIAKAEPFLKE